MTGLERRTIKANGIRINLWAGGNGPPVLLLHGWPQTAQLWHKIAPQLAEHYTVVCPDLRGYGDSDKPRDGYDKKTMARDMHELMRALGHERYALIGHDRGGRVGHRQALDYPDAVTRLCVVWAGGDKADEKALQKTISAQRKAPDAPILLMDWTSDSRAVEKYVSAGTVQLVQPEDPCK